MGLSLSVFLCPSAVPPPTPPAEDVDRQRRRFNMRMLVPGRPVKETPATPPPVPVERPTYKEKFIPPELSMWDYFVAKVRPRQLIIYTDANLFFYFLFSL